MIFVTVGAQMPFDRLIEAVDRWAGEDPSRDVFAQVGSTAIRPRHISWCREMEPDAFRHSMEVADLVVSHAGMGTILTALELEKPILVMPRRACYRETRNDHQIGSARMLHERHGVSVAWDEEHLLEWLERPQDVPAPMPIAPHASFQLLNTLRQFIRHEALPATTDIQPGYSSDRNDVLAQTTSSTSGKRKAA